VDYAPVGARSYNGDYGGMTSQRRATHRPLISGRCNHQDAVASGMIQSAFYRPLPNSAGVK
jgi:hypothetical protein